MVVFVLPVLCFRVIDVIKTYLSPSHSHAGPTQHIYVLDGHAKKLYRIPPVDKMDSSIATIL